MNSKLMIMLSAGLGLGASSPVQSELSRWADAHYGSLLEKAKALLLPPFTVGEVKAIAEEVVRAAQELRGLFAGQDRAQVAQIIMQALISEAVPPPFRDYVLPLIGATGVRDLIEEAFTRIFGEAPKVAPVVDAPELPQSGPVGGPQ